MTQFNVKVDSSNKLDSVAAEIDKTFKADQQPTSFCPNWKHLVDEMIAYGSLPPHSRPELAIKNIPLILTPVSLKDDLFGKKADPEK